MSYSFIQLSNENPVFFIFFRPSHYHHHFGIATLIGVLKRASQKRKFIRDEKSQDKGDIKGKDEASRSESQASEAPVKITLNPQQSMNGKLIF